MQIFLVSMSSESRPLPRIHSHSGGGGQHRFLDFGVNFLPVGTPAASLAPLAEQVLSLIDFVTVFKCPGDALWSPCGTFGRPWACLGATLGVTWSPKVAKTNEEKTSGAHGVSESTFTTKGKRPRGVECG